MATTASPRPRRTAGDPEAVRSVQKVSTFTPGDARRLDLYAEQRDRSTSYLLHQAMIRELDAAGIKDDGVRTGGTR